MEIPIVLNKDSAEECGFDCPFNSIGETCLLFKEDLIQTGYYDSRSQDACMSCQQLYRNYKAKIEGLR